MKRSPLNRGVLTAGMLIAILPAAVAFACRYTVRDIGFVDLRGPEFSLSVVGVDSIPAEAMKRIEQGLRNSNVRLNVVKRRADDGDGDEAGGELGEGAGGAAERSGIEITLIDRGGRRLRLDTHAESGVDEAAMVSDCLPRLFTETRDTLARQSIGSFAQIVVIDGSDQRQNDRAWGVAGEAAEAIRRIEPMLPRPIAFPVRTVRLSLGQRVADPVLLWSLGLHVVSPDDLSAASEAVVAVIYGRGRLAGPVMTGAAIEVRETLAQLALVGESCECETDRKWLDERVVPYRWAANDRELAAQRLGFDPESPLVRAEMIRIVSQGVGAGRSKKPLNGADGEAGAGGAGGGGDAIERLLLGYSESSVAAYREAGQSSNDSPSDIPSSDDSVGTNSATNGTSADATESEMPLSQVRAQIIQGDGWDFDDQESVEGGDADADLAGGLGEDHDAAAFLAASETSSAHGAGESLSTPDGRKVSGRTDGGRTDGGTAERPLSVNVMAGEQSRPIRIALMSSFLVLATVSLGGAWLAWGMRST